MSSRVTHACPVQRAPEELGRALDTPPAQHLRWIPSRSGQAAGEYPGDGPGSAAAEAAEGRPSSGCSAEVSSGLGHRGEARKAPRGVCAHCAKAGREKVAFYERALPVSWLSASSAARNIFTHTHTQVCTSLSGQGFLAFPPSLLSLLFVPWPLSDSPLARPKEAGAAAERLRAPSRVCLPACQLHPLARESADLSRRIATPLPRVR